MKICYLTDNINPKHGGGRYASDLISAVKKTGHEVKIFGADNGGLFLSAIKIRKYLKSCNTIHAIDGYPYAIIAALANLGLKKKLVVTVQGTYAVAPLYVFGKAFFLKWAYKKADKIIAISRYTQSEILKKIKLKNIEIINHGIDFEKFYKVHEDSPENFILSIGALKYRKGYHISIPAFAQAKKKLPDLKYKIIGSQKDSVYFNQLKELTVQYGIQNNVEFLSGLSDEALSDLYRKAKLFILTSVNENHHFEGFGLVFLEAAAASLPAIGTLGNGIEDSVKNGYSGILVPQNNIEATAGAIVKLLKNEVLRKELSLNALEWAKNHDWGKIILSYIRIYNQNRI